MKELQNTDLDIIYSHWKAVSTKIRFLLPPLIENRSLQGLQIVSKSEVSRIDFKLIENQEKVTFYDLNNDSQFHLDLTNVEEGKIRFFRKDSFEDIWERLPLEEALS